MQFDLVGPLPDLDCTVDQMVRLPIADRFDPSKLRQWLSHCDEHHKHASLQNDASEHWGRLLLGGHFRLIDVRTRQIITPKRPESYLALSYVWGAVKQGFVTRQPSPSSEPPGRPAANDVLASFLDYDGSPHTITDAMRLVKEIGHQYLWVDSVCIDQNNCADKHTNIQSMDFICEFTCCTIAAASGADANAGLCRFGRSYSRTKIRTRLVHPLGEFSLLPPRSNLADLLQYTMWAHRGWTY
jgi:hypothetical protein